MERDEEEDRSAFHYTRIILSATSRTINRRIVDRSHLTTTNSVVGIVATIDGWGKPIPRDNEATAYNTSTNNTDNNNNYYYYYNNNNPLTAITTTTITDITCSTTTTNTATTTTTSTTTTAASTTIK